MSPRFVELCHQNLIFHFPTYIHSVITLGYRKHAQHDHLCVDIDECEEELLSCFDPPLWRQSRPELRNELNLFTSKCLNFNGQRVHAFIVALIMTRLTIISLVWIPHDSGANCTCLPEYIQHTNDQCLPRSAYLIDQQPRIVVDLCRANMDERSLEVPIVVYGKTPLDVRLLRNQEKWSICLSSIQRISNCLNLLIITLELYYQNQHQGNSPGQPYYYRIINWRAL